MLEKTKAIQDKIVITTLESLMPREHFLRDLNNVVDFSFIYEKVEHLYSKFGRPAVDPVQLIKMILLGFLYGINSERKIEREIQVNIAYRWFLGLDLDSRVPDHSTISQTRRRKFNDSNIFEEIFIEVVKQCIEKGLVDGTTILTDSTHVKANASMKSKESVTISVEPSEYMKRLDEICNAEDSRDSDSKRGRKSNTEPKTRIIQKSKTDPDSGMLNRPEKPKGFHYLAHQSVDVKCGIITDVHVTPANVDDHIPYVQRIKNQKEKLNLQIKEVGIDKAYDHVEIHKEMYDMGIKTYVPLVDRKTDSKSFPTKIFEYNLTNNTYTCPNNQQLAYTHINKNKRHKIYSASQKICKNCQLKSKCITATTKFRTLSIPLHQHEATLQRANYRTTRYYAVQRLRKIYCEGNFALQKDNHNLRNTRKRGNKNVTEHCLMSALALNLKRMVKHILFYSIFLFISQNKRHPLS